MGRASEFHSGSKIEGMDVTAARVKGVEDSLPALHIEPDMVGFPEGVLAWIHPSARNGRQIVKVPGDGEGKLRFEVENTDSFFLSLIRVSGI